VFRQDKECPHLLVFLGILFELVDSKVKRFSKWSDLKSDHDLKKLNAYDLFEKVLVLKQAVDSHPGRKVVTPLSEIERPENAFGTLLNSLIHYLQKKGRVEVNTPCNVETNIDIKFEDFIQKERRLSRDIVAHELESPMAPISEENGAHSPVVEETKRFSPDAQVITLKVEELAVGNKMDSEPVSVPRLQLPPESPDLSSGATSARKKGSKSEKWMEKGSSPTRRLIELKNSRWEH